ncbi:hypothetical protein KP509_14G024900 [Ceratopteris richardii]|uniref:Thioredoxin domain-containing protein n=1 Tax=Ceratopteris richardii TaxID=49495 RepID=A0A8T2T8M1_CERRI|nr:hypothetical protein KP509_14G024900 [Ceratopteris richardii]
MIHCQSPLKKNNPIKFHTGMFDSILLRRGGSRGDCGGRPRIDKSADIRPPLPPVSPCQAGTNRLKSFAEDAQRDNGAGTGCGERRLMSTDEIASLRSSQPHKDTHNLDLGLKNDSIGIDEIRMEANLNLGVETPDRTGYAIGKQTDGSKESNAQFNVDAKGRYSNDDAKLPKTEQRSSRSRFFIWGRNIKSSERKGIPQEKPSLSTVILRNGSKKSSCADAELGFHRSPSTREGVDVEDMGPDHSNLKNMLYDHGDVKAGEMSSSCSIQATEILSAKSYTPGGELSRSQRDCNEFSLSLNKDVRVSRTINFAGMGEAHGQTRGVSSWSHSSTMVKSPSPENLKDTELINHQALDQKLIVGLNNGSSLSKMGGSIFIDSLSSHGESSSSGSPLANDILKEGRSSSPGDVSVDKDSPYSVSSRSMGSVTGYDNAVNSPVFRTSSNESSDRHQWSVRKSDEMSLGTARGSYGNMKSGDVSSCRVKPDGIYNQLSARGTAYANGNNHNNTLNCGNLLVGGTNGDVLSYSGIVKGNAKQDKTRKGTLPMDSKLLKSALTTSDPEGIKIAANEYFRTGHFLEALTLYDKAVSLSPKSALYRNSRAAALSRLDRLSEALKECEEAIRLDPSYVSARHHAASLYIRLGMIKNAEQHLNNTGQHIGLVEKQRLQTVECHIAKCIKARESGDWHTVIKESDAAVVMGADSAPQIFGFKAEALNNLGRFQEAESICSAARKLEKSLVNSCICCPSSYLQLVSAQVYLALGRFDEAVQAADEGLRIEPKNAIASALLSKAQIAAQARAAGNEHFKRGRFFEALSSYTEGLESDPTNAILLCNRAACRLKLEQWEKAVEDCDAALRVQPNYTKARLRRASCLTKLERWEDALQDYEALKRDLPGNPDVERSLFDVQIAIKISRGEEVRGMKFGGGVEEVTTEEQFKEAIGSAGLSVVQFITRWSERCQKLSPFMNDLCRRHPCVNFVKVDVEDLPYVISIESITFIPTFKIYKDGRKLKELIGPTEQTLEYAVKHYSL